MKTHNPNRLFAYWAILIPCMTTAALMLSVICSGSFSLPGNPMPGNIFETGFLLGILWFLGLLLTLRIKTGRMQTYNVYKDSQGREVGREKSDDIVDTVSDSFFYPLLARFVIFPLVAAAIMYYAVYLLLSLLITVLPYLLAVLCIFIAGWTAVSLTKQLRGDENTDTLLNLTARHYGLPVIVAATLFCMTTVLQSAVTFLSQFSEAKLPLAIWYIFLGLSVLSGVLFLIGIILLIRNPEGAKNRRSTAALVSIAFAGVGLSGIFDALLPLLLVVTNSFTLSPSAITWSFRIIVMLCALTFALIAFYRDKKLRKNNTFYNSALKFLLLISVLSAASNIMGIILIPLMLFFWKKYFAKPLPAEATAPAGVYA